MALPQLSASTESSTELSAPQAPLQVLPKPGRPSLFNPERTAAICALIEIEGLPDSAAGALAGVTSSTLARWKQEHEGFVLELEAARANFLLSQLRALRLARRRDGSPDWRAVAWLLKHYSPEGYGPASRMRKVKATGLETGALTATREPRAELEPPKPARALPLEKKAILPETPGSLSEPEEGTNHRRSHEDAGNGTPRAQTHANLPETPVSPREREDAIRDRRSPYDASSPMPGSQNHASLPETPISPREREGGTGEGRSPNDAGSLRPGSQNRAILPETRAGDDAGEAAGQRLSRRERRAEERRRAKAARSGAPD